MTRKFAIALGLFLLAAFLSAAAQNFPGVLTGHNDNARTGQNLSETQLTPQNVNMASFGKVFSFPVDGQIFAQPLYVPQVVIPDQGMHNVLYVATENDSVYAFDADGLATSPLWHVSFIDPQNSVTPAPCAAKSSCAIYPIVGITSTPVIDMSSETMYVVARSLEMGVSIQRLHALDISSGVEKFGGPVVIAGSYPGAGQGSKGGTISFEAQGTQRAALLLLNGVIYIGWATPAHGWIMAYDAQTLAQVAVFNTTPNSVLGGVWQSGAGLAADDAGYIYAATGDGLFDFITGGVDYGDTVLKLSATLNVVDYFTPMDQSCRQANDGDLGAGGPLVLPTQPGPLPDLLVQAGKGGAPCDLLGGNYAAPIYLLNRDSLGTYNSIQDSDVQTIIGSPGGYWSSPAYWQGPDGTYLYFSGINKPSGDYLKMYSLSGGQLSPTPIAQSPNLFPVGSTPSISASGASNGIVWSIAREDILGFVPGSKHAILYAYDATNVATLLYSSSQAGTRDQAGLESKNMVPTIANGRVYVGTQTEVDVYGLFAATAPYPAAALSPSGLTFANQPVGSSSVVQSVTLSNPGTASLIISSIATTGDFALTSTSTSCPYTGGALYPGSTCTMDVIFTPSQSGTRTGSVTVTDNANPSSQSANLTGSGSITTDSVVFNRTDSSIASPFQYIAAGDFNADGKLDIAGLNNPNGTLSVLLGNGDGTFNLASTTNTGNGPAALVNANFNAGGNLDTVVANSVDDNIAVLIGNGNGTFAGNSPSFLFSTGNMPSAIVQGDWNGDGELDLAVANESDGTVSIFLGNGDGTFAPQAPVAVGNAPIAVATGDFNGDGKPDLAVANSADGTVSILLGNGDGTFTLASTPAVGADPIGLAVGNWNSDGNLDLAIVNGSANTITVLLGNGDGTFNLANVYNTGNSPQGILALDFNSDGKMDLAFANFADNTISLFLGNGDGTFQQGLNFAAANGPCSLAAGDFNGDGQPDIAVGYCSTSTLSVLLQAPQVTLSSTTVSLGNQAVGTTSAALETTLSNTGSAGLGISSFTLSGANPSDFTITQSCGTPPLQLAPGATCVISATFAPAAAGMRSASLSIVDTAQGSPHSLSFAGVGTAPVVLLSPSSLTFGNELVATGSGIRSVLLSNSGNAALAISSIVSSGDYSMTTTATSCPYSGGVVNPGSSCTLDVIFTPSQAGARVGSIVITDNIAGPQSVALGGNGLISGLTLSPSTSLITFQRVQLVGTASAPSLLTLTNNTNTALTAGFAITGTDSADFLQSNNCGNAVPAWNSCTIKLVFAPTSGGQRSATFILTYNGPNSPQTVTLTGTATAVGLNPSRGLVFGSQTIGTSSGAQAITVSNYSTTVPLAISSIKIHGTNAADFSIVSGTNPCGASLAPGASCTISVVFTPSADGTRSASVVISDNGGATPQQAVALSGTGG